MSTIPPMSSEERARIHRIIASQAVTGEAIGIEHYAAMIALAPNLAERLALLEDAWRERAHLSAVEHVAKRAGWLIEEGRDDPYWSRIRAAFREAAGAGDLLCCRLVQDVVLECFAVSLYELFGPRVEAELSRQFELIVRDESVHLQHGIAHVRRALGDDRVRAEACCEFANERVARVLAEWLAPADCAPVCGVCGKVGGGCAKPALEGLAVELLELRASFVNRYGSALREAGFAPAAVARWLSRLLT